MAEHCDVLVVGAGPAGSATARRLATMGHRVILLDKQRFPRDKCCSEYAAPETLRELANLGMLAPLATRGWTALQGTAVTAAHGAHLHGRFADAGGTPYRATGMALPRMELDAALVSGAVDAGVTLHQQYRLEALVRNPDGTMQATCSAPDGTRQIAARLVIGADGLGSRVARLARLRRRGGLRRMAFVAHVGGVTGMRAHAELHVARRGYVGLNPLDAVRTNVAVVVPATHATSARGDVTGFFWRALAAHPQVAARVAAGTVVREVMATGPFDVRSSACTGDGVALVGDAAEFFDPFTGEGIWTALVGARLLADSLDPLLRASAPITKRAFAPYRRARRQRFLGKWMVERAIGHAMRWPWLFDHAVRRIDRAGLGSLIIGVTGDFVSPSELLRPANLWRLVRASEERRAARDLPRLTTHDSRLKTHDSRVTSHG